VQSDFDYIIFSKYKVIQSSDSELFGRVVKDGAVKGESESRSLNKYSIWNDSEYYQQNIVSYFFSLISLHR
jgi:hypothetical protein